jgi:5-methylcytosine-specific restriction protein A
MSKQAPRLHTLKPRLQAANTNRLTVMAPNPTSTPRLRGRAAVDRRARWLSLHPLCVECEKVGRATAADVVDHAIPLWEGGKDDESNFQSLCQTPCHDAKTSAEATRRARG